MRRVLSACLVAAMALAAFSAFAVAAENAAAKSQTVTGEVIDLGCFLGHSAKGAAHKECAANCVANGMPMGLLTDKGVLYLLTLNHDDADPFNKTKGWAGEQVKVTGVVNVRQGMKALQVNAAEPVAAPAK